MSRKLQQQQQQEKEDEDDAIGLSLDNDDDDNDSSSEDHRENDTHSTTLVSKAVEAEVLQRIETLKEQLELATRALEQLQKQQSQQSPQKGSSSKKNKNKDKKKKKNSKLIRNEAMLPTMTSTTTTSGSPSSRNIAATTSSSAASAVVLSKRGYLFKWLDRSIGWGGTKWALRFVVLEGGRLSYYRNHTDTITTASSAPRYVLSLKGCAVRDDGWKRNRRHKSPYSTAPLDEPGAYFFLFSIYQRPYSPFDYDDNDNDDDDSSSNEIVPLLRFSTPSLAEKSAWITLISEMCAYCETDEYVQAEALRAAELDRQWQEQQQMAQSMPEAKEGTLPPLYFATITATTTKTKHNHNIMSTHKQQQQQQQQHPPLSILKKTSSANFRTKSKQLDADQAEIRSTRGYPPSKPMHRQAAPSYLSPEAPIQNYRGLLNLTFLILTVSNVRMFVNSIRKHGLLVMNAQQFQQLPMQMITMLRENPWQEFPFVSGCILQLLFVGIAFGIEYGLVVIMSRRHRQQQQQQRQQQRHAFFMTLLMIFHHLNAHAALAIPTYIVWNMIDKPAIGAILLIQATITWMKLLSYILANQDYRMTFMSSSSSSSHQNQNHTDKNQNHHHHNNNNNNNNNNNEDTAGEDHSTNTTNNTTTPHDNHANNFLALVKDLHPDEENIVYPENITLKNILYFWVCPTLTYQIAFPKTPQIRWLRVGAIVMRMVVSFTLFTIVAAQIVSPTLQRLVHDLKESNGQYTVHMMAEYWLRLAIANTYLWLIMFYFYFHLYLNLFAELFRFGDRVFYKDWWNSSEVSAFWRLWNLPVHYWLIRHLYFPVVRMKVSKTVATFVVFLFSAIMHEFLVSVPFHMIRPWSFIGMMMQMPLVALTKYLYRKNPSSSIGNMIFWLSFCVVGQPMAVMLYTADYQYAQQQEASLIDSNTNSTADSHYSNDNIRVHGEL